MASLLPAAAGELFCGNFWVRGNDPDNRGRHRRRPKSSRQTAAASQRYNNISTFSCSYSRCPQSPR